MAFWTSTRLNYAMAFGKKRFCRYIKELKQGRRRRQRESHLEIWLFVSAVISQLFQVPAKCTSTYPGIKLLSVVGDNKTKLKFAIMCSRRPCNCKTSHLASWKGQERQRNVKNKNCTCKGTKTVVNYANLWGSCHRRRLGCLSSLFSLP